LRSPSAPAAGLQTAAGPAASPQRQAPPPYTHAVLTHTNPGLIPGLPHRAAPREL
jgi:hypothetical protein